MFDYDVTVIGGGPAGLAAAISACDNGAKTLVIEREERLGGMLKQCIHDGFGLSRFGERLAGPEYVERFMKTLYEKDVDVCLRTFVTRVEKLGEGFCVVVVSSEGLKKIHTKTLVLATGCRERSAKQVFIHGTRPAGVFTAGTAQHFTNRLGVLPTKRCVILGSGDIGLIMARRLTLEGAEVLGVYEINPTPSGLTRNIHQCLHDYDIPLYLSHTVTEIEGDKRVTGVTISKVDENRKPIPGTEMHFDCDTVLFSVGLISENELTKNADIPLSKGTRGTVVYDNRETEIEGVFACGNVLHVHDLVDFVSEESEIAGRAAADYILSGEKQRDTLSTVAGDNVSYVLPQLADKNAKPFVKLFFRVRKEIRNAKIVVRSGDKILSEKVKKIVVPGEMENVILTEKMLESACKEICVEVKDE